MTPRAAGWRVVLSVEGATREDIPRNVVFAESAAGGTGRVTCIGSVIASGAARILQIAVRIAPGTHEAITNTATASGSSPDPVATNNAATVVTPLTASHR